MRKLATVQTVSKVSNLTHNLECVEIKDWKVAALKGTFKEGDKCIYIEPDAIMPPNHIVFKRVKPKETSIATKNSTLTKGYAIPLKDIEPMLLYFDLLDFEDGDDLTEFLSIKESETTNNIHDKYKLERPKFIPKKTIPYMESYIDTIKQNKKQWFTVSELLNGINITYFFKDGEFGICSDYTGISLEQSSFYQSIAKRTDMVKKMDILCRIIKYSFAVQGVLVGKTINSNPYKLIGYNFFVNNFINLDAQKSIFKNPDHKYDNVFHTIGGQSVDAFTVAHFLGLRTIPYITIERVTNNIEETTNKTKGESAIATKVPRMGLVYRKMVEDELDYTAFICLNKDHFVKG